jgi:hypothetical protein
MKAISLTQPWASLVAIGAKRIETRSWSTAHRGILAIHASKDFPRTCRAMCFGEPFYSVLHQAGLIRANDELGFGERRFLMPIGGIVAVADLVNVVPVECLAGPASEQELAFGDYSPRRFCWLLAGVRRLPELVPCKGALGLWTVPPEIARKMDGET